MNAQALTLTNLTVSYKDGLVLDNVSCAIPTGIMLAIVGPNGAGKTTLLKALIGLLKPCSGSAHLLGHGYDTVRKKIAYVPQRASVDWDFPVTVFDVVLMGRYVHLGWIVRPKKHDHDVAWYALAQVGMTQFAHRHIGQLSGGQQQRVFLARALAQEAELYLMDEPFAGVDMATEKTMISVLQLLRDTGKTIIVVHHDLQTLDEYFDWVLLLNIKAIACGPIKEVLMPEYICAAYGNRNFFVNPRVRRTYEMSRE